MKALSLTLMSLAITGSALAERIRIRQDDVLPIVFEETLTIKNSRQGDTFVARIDGDRDLPNGTRLIGQVLRVQRSRDGRQGSMDVEFRSLELPDGQRVRIRAIPVNRDYRASRDRDGRLRPNDGGKRGEYVAGGLIGGLVLGSLVKKPFEGAFLGSLAGILLAETEGKNSDGTFVKRGQKAGALFESGVEFDYNGRWSRNDRYGDDRYRDDRYEDDRYRDDRNRTDDWGRQGDRYRSDYDECEVRWDDRYLRYDERSRPYREGDSWMVPLDRTCEQLGLLSEFDDRRNRIYIEDDDNSCVLELDSRNYRVNGKKRTFARNTARRDGVIYVSVELFTELKGKGFSVNERRIR